MGIFDLWLPIVATAVTCFFASSAIWMVFKWHNSDYRRTEREDEVRAPLEAPSPGFYTVPHCADYADMSKPEMAEKMAAGPVAYVTVVPNGMPPMGPKMLGMVVYFLFVAVLCAYVVTRTLPPDADYLAVFRIAGTVAFIANGIAVIPESIWFGRPWSITAKNLLDALIYGLLTGGIFGWLV